MISDKATLAVMRTAWPLALSFLLAGSLWWSAGYVLSYDAVAVPEQSLQPWMWGASEAPPRSVPQDAVIAVADNFIPGGVLQRAMLLAALVLAGTGIMRLMAARALPEQFLAAGAFVWSAYVVERAVIGHWGLLLAYAVMPWVVRACARIRQGSMSSMGAAGLWVALGSLTPTGGLMLCLICVAVLVVPAAAAPFRRRLLTLGLVTTLQLPWITAGILSAGAGGASGSEVFALRADGPGGFAGPILSALTGGGIWNADVVPASRTGWYLAVGTVALVGLATGGFPHIRMVLGDCTKPICALALMGLGWATLTALAPSVSAEIMAVPGGGLLRDGQKWLALWMLPFSVCVGLGGGRILGLIRLDLRVLVAAGLALLPALLIPDAVWAFGNRLAPVAYPADWDQVQRTLASSQQTGGESSSGDVVSLPWVPFRAYDWNDRRVCLDPSPRYLDGGALTSSALAVRRRGEVVVVPSDDPRSVEISTALQSPDPQKELSRAGVGWVLVNVGQPTPPGQPHPSALLVGADLVVDGATLDLYRLRELPEQLTPHASGRGMLISAWGLGITSFLTAVILFLRFANIPTLSRRNEYRATATVSDNDERSSTSWPKD